MVAPSSPKASSAAQRQKPLISPKGRPPPTIAIPSHPSSQSGTRAVAMTSPRSVATEDTADLENKLERETGGKASIS